MRRFYGLLALVVLMTGCGGGSAAKAVKAESESSTTDAIVTTTTAAAGATGPTGPTGATGATGTPGAPGGPGISGYEIVRATKSQGHNRGDPWVASIVLPASCPAGKSILSGGASFTVDPPYATVDYSTVHPYIRQSAQVDAATWMAEVGWDTLVGQTVTMTVTIACAFVA